MKWKYKAVMFLTLLIFCVGSVCATEPNNTTDVVKIVNSELEKRDTIIQNQELRIKNLENNSAEKDIKINELNNTVNSLKDDNKVLTDKVQALEYSKLTQSNRIKSLEIDVQNLEESNKQKDIDIKELKDSNKQLVDSNKVLNNTVNNQTIKINELNNKLDLQVNEIKELQAVKDKLNAEINKLKDEKCTIYEKLLESPKKEDFDQLKKEIDNKNKQIDKLNIEISTLKAILSVNTVDVCNSLKDLSSTKNIKCGKYTFKLEDYLKIPLIKDGKKNVLKFKKNHGRLPNYVTIACYKVPKKVYQKLYNL